MYKTINYCENLIEYWGPALCIYIVPGILFVWAMARMASRNPKYQTVSDEPKAGFFKQCLWILIAMFGGVFVVDKTTHEQFKRHRIVPKAIGAWFVLISIIAIVFGDNKLAFRNAYEMAVKNNTMEIYSGDAQLRAFPSYELHLLLSRIKKLLSFLGVAMYIWYYKPSPTSIWFKARKVIGLFMLYFAYTALVVVYTPFDLMVFGIILLITTLLLIDYRRKNKRMESVSVTVTEESVSSMPIPLEGSEIPVDEINNCNMEQNSPIEEGKDMFCETVQPIIEQESLDFESDDKNIQVTPSPKPLSKRQALMKKILRYAIIGICAAGIITGIVFGIIYIVDDYIPNRKLDKAVNEIIYNFEYGDKDTKRKYAAWILSTDHEWDFKDVADYRISNKIRWHEGNYHKKAFDYVESMAYKGDKKCQCLLGHFYLFGEERGEDAYNSPSSYYTKQDLVKSAYWYNEAAKQDNPTACNNLGTAYKEGRGVNTDMRQAVKWLRKAAELESDYGQRNYGDLFMEGVKIKVGSHKEEYTTTEYQYYGKCKRTYYDKRGEKHYVYEEEVDDYEVLVPKDIEQAKYWWRKAAEQGDEAAKDRLQKIYE